MTDIGIIRRSMSRLAVQKILDNCPWKWLNEAYVRYTFLGLANPLRLYKFKRDVMVIKRSGQILTINATQKVTFVTGRES